MIFTTLFFSLLRDFALTDGDFHSPPLGVLAAKRRVDNPSREDEALAEGIMGGGHGLLLQIFHHLVGKRLVAGNRRVSGLLVDVVQFEQRHVVVVADDAHRLDEFRLQLCVEDEDGASLRIVLADG